MKKKVLVGWFCKGDNSCPAYYWEKTEWYDPNQKCHTLATNIYSQKKMAGRMKEPNERITKVRITIEE